MILFCVHYITCFLNGCLLSGILSYFTLRIYGEPSSLGENNCQVQSPSPDSLVRHQHPDILIQGPEIILSMLRFPTYLPYYISLLMAETKNLRTPSLILNIKCVKTLKSSKVNVDKVLTVNFKKTLYLSFEESFGFWSFLFKLFSFSGFQIPSSFENILCLYQLGQNQSWGRTFFWSFIIYITASMKTELPRQKCIAEIQMSWM